MDVSSPVSFESGHCKVSGELPITPAQRVVGPGVAGSAPVARIGVDHAVGRGAAAHQRHERPKALAMNTHWNRLMADSLSMHEGIEA